MGVKEKILDAAVALLKRSGARALAQPQVAKEAGVPQGHLTYYYPRRSDLLAAVTRRFVDSLAGELMAFLAAKPGRAFEIKELLVFITGLVQDRERTRMLVGLLVEAEEDDALREQLVENAAMFRTALGHAMGRAPGDPDVEIIQAALWGLSIGHLLQTAQPERKTAGLVQRLAGWIPEKPLSTSQKRKPRTKKVPS